MHKILKIVFAFKNKSLSLWNSFKFFKAHSLYTEKIEETQLVKSQFLVSEYFDRLRTSLFEEIKIQEKQKPANIGGTLIFTEHGKLERGWRYFYLKPKNDPGWLFEESKNGWVVSKCEKIVSQNKFLRNGEPFDKVLLYQSDSSNRPKLTSTLQREGMLSYGAYEAIMGKIFSKELTAMSLQTEESDE